MQNWDIQNWVLYRLRANGVNFGGQPTNTATDRITPTALQAAINQKYNEFLTAVQDYPIATVALQVTTTANVNTMSLSPVPPYISFGVASSISTPNPVLMRVYEFSYVQTAGSNPGQERYIPFISTAAFRRFTGAYTQRLGAYAPYPRRVSQRFGQNLIDMFPGTAVSNDTVNLKGTPDPMQTFYAYPNGGYPAASAGGPLVNGTDEPILPPQFHMALVEGAIVMLAPGLDKADDVKASMAAWQGYIEAAIEWGSARAEGDAEQEVIDPWVTSFDIDSDVI